MSETVKAERPGSMVRAASLVSALTMVSRLLGLAREQVFAALLGAGVHADAFNIAYRIPNLLRDLFAEGALSAAFVPTYAATLFHQDRAAAYRLASRLLTLLSASLGVICLMGFLGTPGIVAALAPGYEAIPGKTALTEFLTRVMLPFLPLVSFAAVAMGMLNAEERYTTPALAPAMFNLVAVLIGLGLALAGLPPERAVLGWAAGTVLGGAAQLAIQLPPLLRAGFRFRWEWAPMDPGIGRIVALMAPAAIGLAAVQFNIFISSRFASEEPGAVSWLMYAFRILYLPIGVFGVALGTIATTGLARAAARNDLAQMRATLVRGLRMLAFLTIPATAGLWAVGEPVVRLLYERGRFSPLDTAHTATALSYYAVGLVAFTGVKIVAPAFYALGRPRVPLVGSALAVLTNLAVIAALQGSLGYRAVALGTGLGSILNVALLLLSFERRVGGLRGQGLLAGAFTMALAALPMAVSALATEALIESAVGTRGLAAQLLAGLVPVLAGVLVYGVAAKALRIPEMAELAAAVRRRP